MDKYYYFVSQLPSLTFADESEMTVDNFLTEAQKWVSTKDYDILTKVDINNFDSSQKTNHVFVQYKKFETELRIDIALWRDAERRDLDYKPQSFPASLIKENNPLEVEIKFMEKRWSFIDEMEREHHFDLGFIILYYLKLQILRRYFSFNKEMGLQKFKTLYEVSL